MLDFFFFFLCNTWGGSQALACAKHVFGHWVVLLAIGYVSLRTPQLWADFSKALSICYCREPRISKSCVPAVWSWCLGSQDGPLWALQEPGISLGQCSMWMVGPSDWCVASD